MTAGPFPLRRLTASIARQLAKKSYFEVEHHEEPVKAKYLARRNM
jgi:hypothetical protein